MISVMELLWTDIVFERSWFHMCLDPSDLSTGLHDSLSIDTHALGSFVIFLLHLDGINDVARSRMPFISSHVCFRLMTESSHDMIQSRRLIYAQIEPNCKAIKISMCISLCTRPTKSIS